MDKKVYVVKMNRWGDPEQHSYLIGAFSSRELAEKAGSEESEYRGGKYEYFVQEFELDKSFGMQHVRASK